MSAPLSPGDWVESLIDWRDGKDVLVRGALYCVEVLYPRGGYCQEHGHNRCEGVGLADDPGHSADDCWCVHDFRPIYPGGKLIPLLLEKLPEGEEVDA